jgi:hypothetical protein
MGWFVRTALVIVGATALCLPGPIVAQTPPRDSGTRRVDRTQLMRDVTTLSSPEFEGRRTGSPGSLRARQWLVDRFRDTGLSPAGTDGFLQPFLVTRGDAMPTSDAGLEEAARNAANVLGHVAGREAHARRLVITAHYDHLGMRDGVLYAGADDNASGVGALLAAASYFVRNPPRHPLLFAALDAEEAGQRGARALLDSALLPRGTIAMVVNLDMVSRHTGNEIFAAGTYHTPWLVPLIQDVQTRSAISIRLGHDRPSGLGGGLEDWTRSSDHRPFHEAGIPFVYFGVEDHVDYHTPSDTAERIDFRFLGDAADMIVEAVRTFDLRVE